MASSHSPYNGKQENHQNGVEKSSISAEVSHNTDVTVMDDTTPLRHHDFNAAEHLTPDTHYDAISPTSSYHQNDSHFDASHKANTSKHASFFDTTDRDHDGESRTPRRKRYKDAYENSWKAAKKFASSQTHILSTHSTIEVLGSDINTTCSTSATLMNLIKGFTGTGLLSLPIAFKGSGLWVGLGLFLVVGSLAIHCTHILERCSYLLEKRTGLHLRNYQDTVDCCFANGPPRLKKFAPKMRSMTTFLVQIMQCGFCCVYIVFMGYNVKTVIDQYWSGSPDLRVYEVVICLLLFPYILLKSLRTLAIFSAIANIMYIVTLVIIYQYLFQDIPDVSTRPAFGSWSSLFLFFGTVIFSFEGISLVVPIRSKMERPEDFGGFTGVLTLGMVFTACLYCSMGFFGYLKFGDDAASTITLNLPQDQWLYLSVDLIFAVIVFLSLGIQFYVPINVVWPYFDEKVSPGKFKYRTLLQCLVRIGLLTLIMIVTIIIPHINLLMSLIGALFGSLLVVILPAVMEMITLAGEQGLTTCAIVRNLLIILFGIFVFITGTYSSLVEIINTF